MTTINIQGQLNDLILTGSLPRIEEQGTGDTTNAVFTPLSEIPLNVFADFDWNEVMYHHLTSYIALEGWETFEEEENG